MIPSTSTPMHIIFSADARYAEPFAVAIYSLLANTKTPQAVSIHLFDGGLNAEDKKEIEWIVKLFGSCIEYIDVSKETKYDALDVGRYSTAIYYRLLIPSFFKDHQRLLYLDCDIVVNADIRELYDQDIEGYAVGAVQDMGVYSFQKDFFQKINMSGPEGYFNSGVLLFNIPYWIEHSIDEKIDHFVTTSGHQTACPDQDILNYVLSAHRKLLPSKYNFQSGHFPKRGAHVLVYHFTEIEKPVPRLSLHPAAPHYFHYLKYTKWSQHKAPKPRLKEIAAHYYYRYCSQKMRTRIRKYLLNPLGVKEKMLYDDLPSA